MGIPDAPRPTGRDEIRAAVLDVAARHFATRGTRASLRDIAAEANVNLGLIHRHIGNKEDLLRAVLEQQRQGGAALVASVPELSDAMRVIFDQTAESRYVRLLAWLSLDAEHPEVQEHYPTIEALRDRTSSEEQELGLLASFALMYGWTFFGDQLLHAFGRSPADRPSVHDALGRVVERLSGAPTDGASDADG
jgi:AcrR family transcriptional regulator